MGCLESKPEASKDHILATDGEDEYVSAHEQLEEEKKKEEAANKAHVEHILEDVKAKKGRDRLRGRILDFDETTTFTPPHYPKSQVEAAFLDTTLRKIFLFHDLTDSQRHLLVAALQKETAVVGECIIQQGCCDCDFFYICQSGTMSFEVNGKVVGQCGSGDSFGELALLYDSPRAASVTCVATTSATSAAGAADAADADSQSDDDADDNDRATAVLWKIDQGTFRHLLAREIKDIEGNKMEILSRIDLFADLDRHTVTKFADVLSTVHYKPGEEIIIKGEVGDIFYIVKSGHVRVHDIGLGDSIYDEVKIRGTGFWFGERALLTGEPRSASITAMDDVAVFACDRDTFETRIGSLETVLGVASRKRFLQMVPILSKSLLTDSELTSLVVAGTQHHYPRGHILSKTGDEYSDNPSLCIIKHGKIMVTKADGTILFLGSADYFGDKFFVFAEGQKHTSTVIVEEDTVCWEWKKTEIEAVLGNLERLGKPIPFTPKALDTTLGIEDVKQHRMVGMGAFGKVWLATRRENKETAYALKTMTKRQLIETEAVQGVLREKQIMASTEHPFILPLVGSFQDESFLYLLMPFNQGGELFNVIHADQHGFAAQLLHAIQRNRGADNKGALTEPASQFYGGCLLEALGYLHARNIAYRDLKPENAMLDKDGYCIMIDFGFAKIVVDKTYTLCGTPEYMAPEIIMSKGHDKAADYWSFGVLLYEMLVGESPFYLDNSSQISLFKRIVKVEYECPAYVSDDAKDIIKNLLRRHQASRLGNLSRGHLDVTEHPWFVSLNFQELNERKILAPWKPKITNPLDSSEFDDFSHVEREINDVKTLSDKEQNLFVGF